MLYIFFSLALHFADDRCFGCRFLSRSRYRLCLLDNTLVLSDRKRLHRRYLQHQRNDKQQRQHLPPVSDYFLHASSPFVLIYSSSYLFLCLYICFSGHLLSEKFYDTCPLSTFLRHIIKKRFFDGRIDQASRPRSFQV